MAFENIFIGLEEGGGDYISVSTLCMYICTMSIMPLQGVVCDMGPKNRSLKNEFKITIDQPFFLHPETQDEKVVWLFDTPHLVKLMRMHFMRDGLTLKSGLKVDGKLLWNIYSKAKADHGLHAGFHLTDHHFTSKAADLQNVSQAAQVTDGF